MADIEVQLVGRFSAAGLTDLARDVLIFATPDGSAMLPVWVQEQPDLGGRPSDTEILASVLSSSEVEDPWFAEISTNSRGQMTAGLKQGSRYIDVRPSTLEMIWHAGMLFDVRVKETMMAVMLPVNPAFIDEIKQLQTAAHLAAESDDDTVDENAAIAALNIEWGTGLSTVESPEVVDEFADMWKAMGLSDELGDWLGEEK
ncbi:hypothetical protein ACUY3M_08680 [Corynebacterium suicordis]